MCATRRAAQAAKQAKKDRKERLERLKARRAARGEDSDDSEDSEEDAETRELTEEAIDAELLALDLAQHAVAEGREGEDARVGHAERGVQHKD